MSEHDELIQTLFHMGMQQQEILVILAAEYNIIISERNLKRILKRLHLTRRLNYTPLHEIRTYLNDQVASSSQLHGYRWMHLKCIQHGFVVKRDTVRQLLKEIDPVGVALRSRKRLRRRQYSAKGPNFLWHLDSYDKLKPYGICINGCIDGFSRYILWLRAGFTSSDPKVIGGYFMDSIENLNGCPKKVRADFGTENGHVEQIQILLRGMEDDDHRKAFLSGASTSNQRIECWWSILRKHQSQFWMNLFQKLKDDGYFDGSFLDKSLVQFCFLNHIQEELDEVVNEWNAHRIRKTKNQNSPSGRPVILYHAPQVYETTNYLCPVEEDRVLSCREECITHNLPCDEDVYNLCTMIMNEKSMEFPKETYALVNLYTELRQECHMYMVDSTGYMHIVVGSVMENEEFIRFLRQREIAEEVIQNLQEQKIDPKVIKLMDDQKLQEYFPKYGDRLAVRDYCSSKSIPSKRKLGIIEKYRSKVKSKDTEGKYKTSKPPTATIVNSDNEEIQLAGSSNCVLPVPKRDDRPRQIYLGWIMVQNNTKVQVRENKGGGRRTPKVPKSFLRKDLINLATDIFFPKGTSSHHGKIEDYKISLNDFQMNELEENVSVGEMYEVTQLPHLIFYLTTTPRPTPEEVIGQPKDVPSEDVIISDQEFSFHEEDVNYNDIFDYGFVGNDNPDRVQFDVHRGMVFEDFLTQFKDLDLNCGQLVVRVILPNGDYENAIDAGGVFRDCLTEFWQTFYSKCTLGTTYKVPFIRSDFKEPEWKAIGKVLVKGWTMEKYFPISLAPAFVQQCMFGKSMDLMESLQSYVSQSGSDLIDMCLKNFSEVDEEELLELLQEYECKSTNINASSIFEVLNSIAYKEMVQKPMFIINIWRTLMLEMMSQEKLVEIYNKMKPVSKNVLKLLNGQCRNVEEERVFSFLKKFIKESESTVLQAFLRFCTGSNLVITSSIDVTFVATKGFSRCPVAHVCSCLLEVPSTYESYPEFRSEFNAVLTSNVWIMDNF